MRSLLLALCFPIALCADDASKKSGWSIAELPRPNSGEFTDAQAEARKLEILANVPTPRLDTWKNPNMGFCVHIDKNDQLVAYNHWAPLFEKDRVFPGPISVAEIKEMTNRLPLGGKPAGILITSESSLRESKAIHEVLKVVFKPSVQIFYARRK